MIWTFVKDAAICLGVVWAFVVVTFGGLFWIDAHLTKRRRVADLAERQREAAEKRCLAIESDDFRLWESECASRDA